MLETVTPDIRSFALRGYQAEAVSSVFREFESGKKSTCVVIATGGGKTVVFGTIARGVIDEYGGRVLVLAHRDELIRQAADSLAAMGVESAIEKAGENAQCGIFDDPMCVVASVQTLRGKRLRSWEPGYFKLIIRDECHHATSDSDRAIIDHFRPDWHLGVTATPDRLDGENLGQVYQSVAFEYSMFQAIKEKYLSRLQVVRCETTVDLRDIRTTGGDLNQGDIEEAIRPHIEELALATRKEIGVRRTIVFTPDVGSGQAFASALESLGISAAAISGDSPNRAEILAAFRHGKYRVLVNCQLLTEGFDAPFVSAIVLARPTKSRALFSQMVGRGTRLFPGKENCLVVDFSWLTGKHQLVKPTDLFDTTQASPEVQAIANELVDKGEEPDLMLAIEKAEKTARERQLLRIKARERDVRYRRVSYDPMAVADVFGFNIRPESDSVLRTKATANQVRTLEKFGITGAAEMSKRRASMYIDKLIENARLGRATVKQKAHLIANGVPPEAARVMPIAEASQFLSALWGDRKRVG